MKLIFRSLATCVLSLLVPPLLSGFAQSAAGIASAQVSIPTFIRSYSVGGQSYSYTVVGNDPSKGGTTTIPTVLVPIALSFEAPVDTAGRKAALDAGPDVRKILRSPIFQKYAFASGTTQYGDAMQRAAFHKESQNGWHTLLGQPEVTPLKITVPVGFGYLLTSRKTGRMLAVVDVEFLQRKIFAMLPETATGTNKLVIAVTRDVTFYAYGDATVCCSWGTHGVDTSGGSRQPFVLGTYLDRNVVTPDSDIQPLTQQLAQWFLDPLHDPLLHGRNISGPGNRFPAWMRPANGASCGGTGAATALFLNAPTDINQRGTVPESGAFIANAQGIAYHLENVALIPWYTETGNPGSLDNAYSFPDAHVLTAPAAPCPVTVRPGTNQPFGNLQAAAPSTVAPVAMTNGPNGHYLIGYWTGYGPIRDVSPQWDIIIVAFAKPTPGVEGQVEYQVHGDQTADQVKSDIAWKQSQGKKVMISIGGGGEYLALPTQESLKNFVTSVEQIVEEYHFNGIDIDLETPSLDLDPGDNDLRHPTTPSIVNLISALHQIHDHFGPDFMISLVPEGTQVPAGYPSYGGQFGSYLPIIEGTRDILTFVDTQDYNTPPLEGLDGEFYMPGSVEYHAAVTELVLQGFPVGRNPKQMFQPLPPEKVAIGFLNGQTDPEIVQNTLRYLITGRSKLRSAYKLRKPTGYPELDGAMFWTIDQDRRESYRYSNTVGPLLHSYPAIASSAAAKQ